MRVETLDGGVPETLTMNEDKGALPTRYGPMPIVPERQVEFHGGLPGFPGLEWFQVGPLPRGDTGMMLLQSIDDPDVGFLLSPMDLTASFIAREDSDAVCRDLGIAPDDLSLMVIVSVRRADAGIETFVNLRAPLFIDTRRRVGAQVVMQNDRYPLRLKIDGRAPGAAA